MWGLSPGTCLPNLKFVPSAVLELLVLLMVVAGHRNPEPGHHVQVILYSVQCCYAVHWTDNNCYIERHLKDNLHSLRSVNDKRKRTRSSAVAVIADRTAYDVRYYRHTGKLSNRFRFRVYERLIARCDSTGEFINAPKL